MRVTPIDLPRDEQRAELETLRRPVSIAVIRAKNPFNIGAIIRVAHSFAVREVILVGSEPWYERAAMGMQRFENVVELPDVPALVSHARAAGLSIVALERDSERCEPLWDVPLPLSALLVLGNEDDGVGPELLAAADQVVAIPMLGINNSFPVAMAAAMGLAEWSRRYHRAARVDWNGATSLPGDTLRPD